MAFQLFGKLSLDGSGFQAGLAKAKSGAQKLKGSIGKSFRGMGKAIAGALAVAAITSQIRDAIEWGVRIRNVAKAFGMSTEYIQKLEYAALRSGVSIEEVMDAHKDLGKSTSEALAGVAGKVWAFEALGITIGEIRGKNIDEVFMRVAKAIHDSGDILTPEQAKAIEDLGGGAMFKLIQMMRLDLPAVFAELEGGAGLVEDAAIQRLGRLSDEMEIFKRQNTGIWADMVGVMYGAWFKFVDYLSASTSVYAEQAVAAWEMIKRIAKATGALISLKITNPSEWKKAFKEITGAAADFQKGTTFGYGAGPSSTIGEVQRRVKAKEDEREAALEGKARDDAQLATGARLIEILKGRASIAEKLKRLDEESEKRRFGELSTAQQLLHLEMQLWLERSKLAKLKPEHTAAEIAAAGAALGGVKGSEKMLAMEAENLLRAEQEKAVLALFDETGKAKARKDKEIKDKAAPMELAGGASYSALARIGGRRGGRNPVLDLAKRQFLLQQAQAQTGQQMAGSLNTIAGI